MESLGLVPGEIPPGPCPTTWHILCPGPSLEPWLDLGPEAPVIVVNAAMAQAVRADYWVHMDRPTYGSTEISMPRALQLKPKVVTMGVHKRNWQNYAPTLEVQGVSNLPEWFQPKPSMLAAIAQAQALGAKEIVMHGCDLSGSSHCVDVPAASTWDKEAWRERWEGERLMLNDWIERAAKSGVTITRV